MPFLFNYLYLFNIYLSKSPPKLRGFLLLDLLTHYKIVLVDWLCRCHHAHMMRRRSSSVRLTLIDVTLRIDLLGV